MAPTAFALGLRAQATELAHRRVQHSALHRAHRLEVIRPTGVEHLLGNALGQLAQSVATKVLDTGEPYHFEPMSAMERRVVHMTILGIEGLATESEGEGRRRHVVVFRDRGDKNARA